MLYQVKSSKSLDDIERDLKDSAARHQFGIIATHNLKETLNKKGVALSASRVFASGKRKQ